MSLVVASHVLWYAGNTVGPMLMVLPCCVSSWQRQDPMAESIESCRVRYEFQCYHPYRTNILLSVFHFKTGKCFRGSKTSLFIAL